MNNISQLQEELNSMLGDCGKPWTDGNLALDMKRFYKSIRQRPQPYAWYCRDLKRKRPNRKQGRNLYRGILAYRQRVGQHLTSKKGLGFRGVATIYDRMRINVLRGCPNMASHLPDLYTRFMNVRFPVAEFHAAMLGIPGKQERNRGIDFGKYGIPGRIRIDASVNMQFVTPAIITAGADAISKDGTYDDAVAWVAMAIESLTK